MTDTNKPDDADLPALVIQGRFAFLQMAQALLDADFLITGWGPDALAQTIALKGQGWRIGLEIAAAESGAVQVALIAVATDGERRVLDSVSDRAPARAN